MLIRSACSDDVIMSQCFNNITMKLQPILIAIALLGVALAQSKNISSAPTAPNFIEQNLWLIVTILLLSLLLVGIFIDKRHGSRYMGVLRRKTTQFLQRIQQMRTRLVARKQKKEKLSGDDAIPTSKDMQTNIFDTEKTFVEGQPSSIQEASTLQKKMETMSNLELQDETPKVDLREVFGQKDGQTSKRSKSKIRGRVQIKKSEREEEDSQETKESKEANSFEIAPEE